MKNYDIGYCYLCKNHTTYYITQDYSYCNFHIKDALGVSLKYPTFLCICNMCGGDGMYEQTANATDCFIRNTLNDYVELFDENEILKYKYKP